MRVLGRFLFAVSVGVLILLVGVTAAIVLGGFALLERAASPGQGFLVLEFIAIGVFVCMPIAIAAACWVLFRPERTTEQDMVQRRGALFLGR